ncbi:erythromycin resistance leader peptide [Lactobacillus crispatus]
MGIFSIFVINTVNKWL